MDNILQRVKKNMNAWNVMLDILYSIYTEPEALKV